MSFLPDEVLELRASNKVLRSLVKRAAELLIKWEHPGIDVEWLKERKQWFIDAGMEK